MVSGHPGCHGNPYSMAACSNFRLKFRTVYSVVCDSQLPWQCNDVPPQYKSCNLGCHGCAKE